VVSSSFFFFFFSSPNLSRRRLDVYQTSTHGVALVRISDAVTIAFIFGGVFGVGVSDGRGGLGFSRRCQRSPSLQQRAQGSAVKAPAEIDLGTFSTLQKTFRESSFCLIDSLEPLPEISGMFKHRKRPSPSYGLGYMQHFCNGTRYWHLFHAARKSCENQLSACGLGDSNTHSYQHL